MDARHRHRGPWPQLAGGALPCLALLLGLVAGSALVLLLRAPTPAASSAIRGGPPPAPAPLSASAAASGPAPASFESRAEDAVLEALVDLLSKSIASASGGSGGSPQAASSRVDEDPEGATATQQTCYMQSDESELCVYENALCYDGEGPVVLVADPIRSPRRVLDYTHECSDTRFYEPSALEWSNCHWAFATSRFYKTDDIGAVTEPGTDSSDDSAGFAHDSSLPLGLRRWGPTNRNTGLIFREMAISDVLNARGGDGGEATADAPPSPPVGNTAEALAVLAAVDAASGGTFEHERVPSLSMRHAYFAAPLVLNAEDEAAMELRRTAVRIAAEERARRAGTVPPPPPPARPPGAPPPPLRVEWLEGALWLVGFEHGWKQNPFHFFSKVSMLYDAQRSNATTSIGPGRGASYGSGGHAADGFVAWQLDSDVAIKRSVRKLESPTGTERQRSRALWRQGAQWGPLPPMDNVLFAGPDPATDQGSDPSSPAWLPNQETLGSWFRGVLALSAQPHARFFFNAAAEVFGPDRLLCARHGAIVGTKYRFFTGRSDAIVFRNAAYKLAGIELEGGHGDVGSHPRFPPRRITLIDRSGGSGRGLGNLDEVKNVLAASGLPFDVVSDMAALSFADQVRLMARTGILVSAHGAALTNLVFLPAHSTVIELFPVGLKKVSYSAVAPLLDVQYTALYSTRALPPSSSEESASIRYSRYYYDNCVVQAVSSYDATVTHACNQMAKLHPIFVDVERFAEALAQAAEAIGAFSYLNPAWATEAQKLGKKPVTYEQWTEGRPTELMGDSRYDTGRTGGGGALPESRKAV